MHANILTLTLLLPAAALAAKAALSPIPSSSRPLGQSIPAAELRRHIEEDWLRQAEAFQPGAAGPVTTRSDARGACDGVKNGRYGFHTAQEPNPWWQVDLGEVTPLAHIVVFNRLDYAPGLHNADNLRVLVSNDGRGWTLLHENKATHFGGVSGAKPLTIAVSEKKVSARFVRLQIPSDKPIYFHLDEVEILGPGSKPKNLALHRPADQSSLSPWSTAKRLGGAAPRVYPTAEFITSARQLAAGLGRAALPRSPDPKPTSEATWATQRREHRSARSLSDGAAQQRRPTEPHESALRRLDDLEHRLNSLRSDASDDERRGLYLETRWAVRELVFSNPLLNFDRLLFVKRFTQETYPDVCLNHMPWVSRPGGDLCVLSAPRGQSLFGYLAAPPRERDGGASLSPARRAVPATVSKSERVARRAEDSVALPTYTESGVHRVNSPAASPLEDSITVRHLLNRALGPGHVHGMDLSWDGRRIVFGYARAKSDQPPAGWLDRSQSYRLRRTEEPIHIFEIGVDGKRLRQLTSSEWSDLDPTYAPNGDIVFVSERCGTSLQCNEFDKDETSCNLYVMKPDGRGVRRLSVSKDGDYLPHTLDDGTIAYTRWEYHERSWAFIQSIWTVRPDGTGADAIFKQHFVDPWALEDTRSIPGSTKLVSIAAGHHTLAAGPLVIVNPARGINEPAGISIVTRGVKPPEGGMAGVPVPEGGVRDGGGFYSTPWALSEKHFLVSYTYSDKQTDAAGYALYLVDVFGNKELVFRDPAISSFIPIPLRARPRPPILSGQIDLARADATCVVSDASFGSEGIDQVRFIRVSEPIGWPYDNDLGGQRYGEDHGYGGPGAERKNLLSWTPIRILGDVPVERDGSAHFRVPADTAVYFQLLDENRMELRRMRSFISFQPGEVRACVGCHETRGVSLPADRTSLAASRAPSTPVPPPWGDRPISFLRDVQPILDRHCASCHSGLQPAGGLDFFAGLTSHDPRVAGYGYNRAYETIVEKELVSISKVRAQDASITPPLAYGSRKSKLVHALGDRTHADKVRLNEDERLRLTMWIDANAPYHDGFVNKRTATRAYDLAADVELKKKLMGIHARRCGDCHAPEAVSRLDWIDFRDPPRSLFLAAPLATNSTRCIGAVYGNHDDSDYITVLRLVNAAVERAWRSPRRDLATFINESKPAAAQKLRSEHRTQEP